MENKKHIVAITAVIKYNDKFLIVKRNSKEIAYPGKWTIPGGKAEKGESIIDVLKREIKEEVGLDIGDEKEFLRDYTFVRPDKHNVIGFTFLVTASSDDVRLGEDFEDFKWILPHELKDYDHIEGIKEEIKKAFPDSF